LSEQCSIEREGESQRKGERDHELAQSYIGQEVVHQVACALVHPPAETTGADRSGLARERDKVVLLAGLTEEACEASTQDSTGKRTHDTRQKRMVPEQGFAKTVTTEPLTGRASRAGLSRGAVGEANWPLRGH
jgi:hypothetical protein